MFTLKIIKLLIILFIALLSLWTYFNFSFSNIFLVLTLLTVLIGLFIRKIELTWIILSSVFLALFLGELYFKRINDNELSIKNKNNQVRIISRKRVIDSTTGNIIEGLETLSGQHKIAGYGPKANHVLYEYLKHDDKVLVDAIYTVNKDGLRITKDEVVYPTHIYNNKPCILFFGCSITYGISLSDSQTLPYIVGSHFENNVYNFAYGGYGPHQMYAYITSGKLDEILHCDKGSIAFFSTAYDHVNRAAGYRPWNIYDPKYELINGKIVHVGTFSDYNLPPDFERSINWRKLFSDKFSKSYIFKYVFGDRIKQADDYDIERYIALITNSRRLLKDNYGFSEFYIIYHDEYKIIDSREALVIELLQNDKTDILKVSKLANDMRDNLEKYTLYDLHPNEKMNKLIFNKLNEMIFRKNSMLISKNDGANKSK